MNEPTLSQQYVTLLWVHSFVLIFPENTRKVWSFDHSLGYISYIMEKICSKKIKKNCPVFFQNSNKSALPLFIKKFLCFTQFSPRMVESLNWICLGLKLTKLSQMYCKGWIEWLHLCPLLLPLRHVPDRPWGCTKDTERHRMKPLLQVLL